MKQLTLLLSVVALITSCETKNVEVKSTDVVVNGQHIQEYVIDSCEYIVGVHWGSHKGNCKFCEKRRMEIIETILNK